MKCAWTTCGASYILSNERKRLQVHNATTCSQILQVDLCANRAEKLAGDLGSSNWSPQQHSLFQVPSNFHNCKSVLSVQPVGGTSPATQQSEPSPFPHCGRPQNCGHPMAQKRLICNWTNKLSEFAWCPSYLESGLFKLSLHLQALSLVSRHPGPDCYLSSLEPRDAKAKLTKRLQQDFKIHRLNCQSFRHPKSKKQIFQRSQLYMFSAETHTENKNIENISFDLCPLQLLSVQLLSVANSVTESPPPQAAHHSVSCLHMSMDGWSLAEPLETGDTQRPKAQQHKIPTSLTGVDWVLNHL